MNFRRRKKKKLKQYLATQEVIFFYINDKTSKLATISLPAAGWKLTNEKERKQNTNYVSSDGSVLQHKQLLWWTLSFHASNAPRSSKQNNVTDKIKLRRIRRCLRTESVEE